MWLVWLKWRVFDSDYMVTEVYSCHWICSPTLGKCAQYGLICARVACKFHFKAVSQMIHVVFWSETSFQRFLVSLIDWGRLVITAMGNRASSSLVRNQTAKSTICKTAVLWMLYSWNWFLIYPFLKSLSALAKFSWFGFFLEIGEMLQLCINDGVYRAVQRLPKSVGPDCLSWGPSITPLGVALVAIVL